MKSTLLFCLAALLMLAACGKDDDDVVVGSGGGDLEFEDFEQPLEEHGVWVEVEDHGLCWYPDDVDDDWRPYSHGHWVWTDEYGWYWVSDYEWGWACEHYGRWTHVHGRWHWVPGYEWSGAWVVWRDGGGYVGWAPLPPSVGWSVSVGIGHDVHWDSVIYEPSWVFVAEVDFVSPHVHRVVVHDVNVVIHKTKVRGSISVSGGRPMNHAIKVHEAEKFTGKKVPRGKLEQDSRRSASKDDSDKGRDRERGPERDKGDRDRPDRDKPDPDKPDRDKPAGDKPDRDKPSGGKGGGKSSGGKKK